MISPKLKSNEPMTFDDGTDSLHRISTSEWMNGRLVSSVFVCQETEKPVKHWKYFSSTAEKESILCIRWFYHQSVSLMSLNDPYQPTSTTTYLSTTEASSYSVKTLTLPHKKMIIKFSFDDLRNAIADYIVCCG